MYNIKKIINMYLQSQHRFRANWSLDTGKIIRLGSLRSTSHNIILLCSSICTEYIPDYNDTIHAPGLAYYCCLMRTIRVYNLFIETIIAVASPRDECAALGDLTRPRFECSNRG